MRTKIEILKYLIKTEWSLMRKKPKWTRPMRPEEKSYCRLIHSIRIKQWISELREEYHYAKQK